MTRVDLIRSHHHSWTDSEGFEWACFKCGVEKGGQCSVQFLLEQLDKLTSPHVGQHGATVLRKGR